MPLPSDIQAYFDTLPERRAEEAVKLDELFRKTSGYEPKLVGTMIGYGSYDYTYESGHSGTSLATGFAPRKAKLTIYIMPGYTNFDHILERLGPHSKGKACLYITRLERVDLSVLKELVRAGLDDLATRWTITP